MRVATRPPHARAELLLPAATLPMRPDPFDEALSKGFYLYAQQRMTYLSVRSCYDDPMGWMIHRFVTFEGKLIAIRLPPEAQIYVWPVGQGPRPRHSVCCRGSIWGRIPKPAGAGFLLRDEVFRLHWLWSRAADHLVERHD